MHRAPGTSATGSSVAAVSEANRIERPVSAVPSAVQPPVPLPDRTGFAEEFPFQSRWLNVGGHRMHYIDEGSGEVLLMVHGNPTWSFYWRRLIQHFSRQYRVVAIDHVGCGWSDRPTDFDYRLRSHIDNLQSVVEQLGLDRITLLVHDWGGAIGMGTAARLPDRFSRFVLCNTAAFRSRAIPWRIAVCRIPLFGALAVRGLNAFARAALSMAVEHRERMTPAVRRGLLAPYGNWHDRIAVLRFVEDIPLKPAHPSYSTLVEVEQGLAQFAESPVLLVWGEKDWCFTPAFRREFEQRLPRAESFPIDDAGHYVVEDAHERMIPRVEQFLADHPLPTV